MAVNNECTSCTNCGLVKKDLSANVNRRPAPAPRTERKGTVVATGHRSRPVAPDTMVTPAQKGSVFKALNVTNILGDAA